MCDSQLEERYIVIKLSDMDEVVRDEIDIFMRVYGIKQRASVVVESDWPVYAETVAKVLGTHKPASRHVALMNHERALFERAIPLPPGVEWREEMGNEGMYCVYVDGITNPHWGPYNGAFHVQMKWEVWKVRAQCFTRIVPQHEEISADNCCPWTPESDRGKAFIDGWMTRFSMTPVHDAETVRVDMQLLAKYVLQQREASMFSVHDRVETQLAMEKLVAEFSE